MNKSSWQFVCLATVLIAVPVSGYGQQGGPPDHPTVTVQGKSWNPKAILARNRGTPADEDTQLTPVKIIGNLYYVGTRTLSTYLIVTPAGNILIDSGYEHSVKPVVVKSVEQLGFKFTDIKYILNNHEHGDHVEGDFLVKELTGGQVVEIAEGVEGLKGVKPNGKEHPIDKVIHDGDTISLGGMTLTARLVAGHAHGGTAWLFKETEGGKAYDVVIASSVRVGGGKMSPEVIAEYNRTFPLLRSLPCDVPLGDHTETFSIQEKIAKMKKGGPNPFIDPGNCNTETDVEDSMFHAVLDQFAQSSK